jgi:signal transduction histidine kinase/DNA-binding response OmpR family regulator/HAMP domain-containing protein
MAKASESDIRIANDSITDVPVTNYSTILRTLIAISVISTIVFIVLSYLTRELGYYLLTISSAITLVFSIASHPRPPKQPAAFIVFLLSISYQLLLVLLASILPSYLGIPYAILSVMLAFILTSVIPRSTLSDWIVTTGILGAIAALELSVLALLPQLNNPTIASIVVIIAVLMVIKVSEMFGEGRIIASIRTKLLLISLALTLIPLIILSFISNRFLRTSIETQSNESLRVAAEQTRLSVDDFIQSNLDSLEIESSLSSVRRYLALDFNERANSDEEAALRSSLLSLQTKEQIYQPIYAVLDLNGNNIYSTDRASVGTSEANTSYFQSVSTTGISYVSSVEFPDGSSAGVINFISPVKSESAQLVGYLRARYDARILQSILDTNLGLIGNRSYPLLLDEYGLRIADSYSPNSINHFVTQVSRQTYDDLLSRNRVPASIPYEEISQVQTDLSTALTQGSMITYYTANLQVQDKLIAHSGTMVSTNSRPWKVAYLQDQSNLTSSLSNQNRLSTTISLLMAAIVSLFVIFASRQFSKPIIDMTHVAEKIADGDLTVQTEVRSTDEIGTLGTAFNSMTTQLRDLVETLETRVRERTQQLAVQNESLQLRSRQLQTVAEVARSIVSTREVDNLLNQVTRLVSDRFGFYHAGIFLLDEKNEYAVLRAANSEGGRRMLDRRHRLRVGQVGIVGYVTGSGEPRIATDVGEDAVFFNNPDLPETRSEMALPLKLGGMIIGALDVQSKESNAFTEADVNLFTTLADQISVAIENANAYELSQQTVEEMKELDRVKSQFLANMSHELRTPLNSVIGFSRVILKGIDGPINDTQEQDITAIYNSGLHLLSMINEILDLSKIEAGKMELQIDEVEIGNVVKSAVNTASGLIKGKPVQLVTQVEPDLPIIKGDEMRLNQILTNLLGNAVKFTEKGSITIKADLNHTEDNSEEILITVADTGIGIAPEDQGKLFQRFSQVDDSPTRRTGGTGLGLSIARSLVELHGGRIGLLRSETNLGSTFFFTIPVIREPAVQVTEVLPPGENIILSIDDDPQVITLYERFLKPYGYEVVALTNPALAVERARELKPFAITLDIMMPDKDGWQVLSELKKDDETKDIPVMICSILQEEEKGFNLGASEYLVKPFLHDDLANAIKRLDHGGEVHDVLIIDDDPQYLRFLQKMIEDEGQFLPVLADSGLAALKLLNDFTPDVIIMDLLLDDISGFELLDKFNSEARLKQVPVIIITGSDFDEDQLKTLGEYGEQVFSKWTINKEDLLVNLQETLNRIRPTHLVV